MSNEDKDKLRSYLIKHHTYTFKEPIKAFVLREYIAKEKKNGATINVKKIEKTPCLLNWASISFDKSVPIYPGIIFFADINGSFSAKGENKIVF